MSRTILSATTEGLRRELKELRRSVMDLKRDQGWQFDTPEPDAGGDSADLEYGSDTILAGFTSRDVPHTRNAIPETVVVTPRSLETLAVTARDRFFFTVSRAGTTGDLAFDWVVAGTAAAPGGDYDSLVMADSPVLYIKLDDASGTTATATAGADGTYVGSPTLGVAGPGTDLPNGMSLDGVNDRMEFVPSGLGASGHVPAGDVASQPQTIEFWANSSTTISGTSAAKYAFGPTSSTLMDYVVFGNEASSGSTVMIRGNHYGEGGTTRWSGFSIAPGWHHHALVFDASTAGDWTYYLDGTPTGTRSSSGSTGAGGLHVQTYWLGAVYGPIYSAWAGMAALAIYDSALTSDRITAHYNASVA